MFTDWESEVVSFSSSWKKPAKDDHATVDECITTDDIVTNDCGSQSTLPVDSNCQTEVLNSEESLKEFNEFKLLSFLDKMLPLMLKQLELSQKTRAFDGYEFLEGQKKRAPDIVHQLEWENDDKLSVSALSWNCLGSVIACGFSKLRHDQWCSHQSSVRIWNISRSDFKTFKPLLILPTDSCISSLKFHSTLPNVLSGGSFNGDVLIWNIVSGVESLLGSSKRNTDGHDEPVVDLLWYRTSVNTNPVLMSLGTDGKILIWKTPIIMKEGASLEIVQKLKLFSHQPFQKSFHSELGLTCGSFGSLTPDSIYLGTEGGHMCKCNFSFTQELSGKHSDFAVPKNFISKCHGFGVIRTFALTKMPGVAISVSSDGEVFFHEDKGDMLTLIHKFHLNRPITCATISPTRGSVILLGDKKGNIDVIDFALDASIPTSTICHSTGQGLTRLEWNNHNPSLFACGHRDGVVNIWRLYHGMDSHTEGDNKQFKKFLSGTL